MVLLVIIGFCGPAGAFLPQGPAAAQADESQACDRLGWFPDQFGLKDHTVFWHDGLYYIASIYLGEDAYEDRFAYASSLDLCHWTYLGGILEDRPAGAWDEYRIWAPFVLKEGGVYYMYYTGVTTAMAQSIMLATSVNPANPTSWQREGVVFQPSHPGSLWQGFDTWSDCRDATVIEVDGAYHMYYTGRDTAGGIVGLATALSPRGPWSDWGAVVTNPSSMPESPTVTSYSGYDYLFYNDAGLGWSGLGEVYHVRPVQGGAWSDPLRFYPGWAHEIWTGQDGGFYTSYLTDYSITIRRLTWNEAYSPPRPFVGEIVQRVFMPLIGR